MGPLTAELTELINSSRPFSDLSDDTLCELLWERRKECPRSGYRMMLDYLHAGAYQVPQLRMKYFASKLNNVR